MHIAEIFSPSALRKEAGKKAITMEQMLGLYATLDVGWAEAKPQASLAETFAESQKHSLFDVLSYQLGGPKLGKQHTLADVARQQDWLRQQKGLVHRLQLLAWADGLEQGETEQTGLFSCDPLQTISEYATRWPCRVAGLLTLAADQGASRTAGPGLTNGANR